MDAEETDASGDTLRIEIGDADGWSTPAHSRDTSIVAALLARHLRAFKAMSTAAMLLLAVAVIVAGFPRIQLAAAAWLADLAQANPFQQVIDPPSDRLYLLPNPPGSSVILDGQTLGDVPAPGDPQPLRLAPGRHTFLWESNAFPFRRLTCVLSVPHRATDTCPLTVPIAPNTNATPPGTTLSTIPILTTHFSLATLPDREAAALTQVIQSALVGATSAATVEPGELYLPFADAPPVSAARPLRAMLSLNLLPFDGADPCSPLGTVHPCYFAGQNCGALCTYGGPGIIYSGVVPVWIAGFLTQLTWDYATGDGRLVANHVPQYGFGVQLVMLGILWGGQRWYALPLFGHHDAIPPSDDLLCDSAFSWLVGGPAHSLVANSATNHVGVSCVSSPTPAEGCVVSISDDTHAARPTVSANGTALLLERFGVLLAVNDAAHALWPALPQADSSERQFAVDLAGRFGV